MWRVASVVAFVVMAAWLGYQQSQINALRPAPSALVSDQYLGLPVLDAAEDQRAYRPTFVGRVRYVGNIFGPANSDALFLTKRLTDRDPEIVYTQSQLLSIGEEFDLVEDAFRDLHIGKTLVKVRRDRDKMEGYITLDVLAGEMTPATLPDSPTPQAMTSTIDGLTLLMPFAVNANSIQFMVQAFERNGLEREFSVPNLAGVHPLTAGNKTMVMLTGALLLPPDDPYRAAAVETAEAAFSKYIIPAAKPVGGGLMWANEYDFPVAWYQKMIAPWGSSYSNGVIASAAALMFRLTGEEKYAEISRKAVEWLKTPVEQGGALYRDGAFSFVAEYPTKGPNIRILDGELIAVVSVYNTAILLRDEAMLRFSLRLAYSLAAQLHLFTTSDWRIQNARYEAMVTTDSYLVPMKRWAYQLGMITKDARFFEAAEKWRLSKVNWPQ